MFIRATLIRDSGYSTKALGTVLAPPTRAALIMMTNDDGIYHLPEPDVTLAGFACLYRCERIRKQADDDQ